MVNIGVVMESDATINHPNGATIIIPARPFCTQLDPTRKGF